MTPPPPEAQAGAEAAATAWLAQVDAADYSGSWSTSAAIFRGSITSEGWAAAVKPVREPLGAVKHRTLQSADFRTTMPGSRDGEYVVLTYATSFERKASAIETITPMKEDDGHWAVSGYYIR